VKPKVLVLGATGMLGHMLCLSLRETCEVWGGVRSDDGVLVRFGALLRIPLKPNARSAASRTPVPVHDARDEVSHD